MIAELVALLLRTTDVLLILFALHQLRPYMADQGRTDAFTELRACLASSESQVTRRALECRLGNHR
jgi:hypothetical protein